MTAPSGVYDIVIVGRSLIGSALALAFRSALPPSFRIAMIEQRPAAAAAPLDLRASALSLASRHALDAIGVWSSVGPEAEPVREIEITDATPHSPIRPVLLHFDNMRDGEVASYIVPNAVLKESLGTALAGASGLHGFDDATLTAIEQHPGHIDLHLADGTRLRARLAVAADGRQSGLRSLAGIKTVGWSYGQHGIVATVAHELPHQGRATQHFLPSGPFAILPLKGSFRSSLVWSERSDAAKHLLALDDAAFAEELRRRFTGRLGELTIEGPRQAFPLDLHLARSFHTGRVVLVGDSARGVHPLAGQGFNIGLRDVAALAEIVVETARLGLDIGSAEPLERYQRWRRFDSVASALGMDSLNRLFSNDSTVLRVARDIGLGVVDRTPVLKRLLVAEAAGMTGELPRLLRGDAI
ncbi:MAG: FAD-dependent monooxygenase [Hyphomicrobiaceae bacterium]